MTTKIINLINKEKVVIFGLVGNSDSAKTRELLFGELGIENGRELEIDIENDIDLIAERLRDSTGVKKAPWVFIGGKYIGGYDEVKAAFRDKSLFKMLDDAKVQYKKVAKMT